MIFLIEDFIWPILPVLISEARSRVEVAEVVHRTQGLGHTILGRNGDL